ncbi:MAG: ATP-binding cassette domain-containing protein [Anaerolineae bacterium]
MSSNSVIEVRNVTKAYNSHVAVDDLSFELRAGEIFAFLGPNGAGKTTTMRMILDILRPDRGEIVVMGGPLTEEKKQRIGYMPEERGLYQSVKLLDLMVYLGALKGMSTRDARQRATELLERVDLGEYLKKKVSELSKGMQQKAQFVATILHQPDIIIVDEPFSGLDPVNTRLLKDMIFELKQAGVSILMSTHMMHQVEEMGDRLLMIDRGRCVLYGEVEVVRSQFASNAVWVRGEGDWMALPGVLSVEPGRNGNDVLLHLADGMTTDDLLRTIANSPQYRLRSFTEAVPGLEEIFVQVVGGEVNGGGHVA